LSENNKSPVHTGLITIQNQEGFVWDYFHDPDEGVRQVNTLPYLAVCVNFVDHVVHAFVRLKLDDT